MSREVIVAKRYAKALFELAQENGGAAAQVEQELKLVVDTISASNELEAYLKHPGVPLQAKVELLKQVFEGRVSGLVANTLQLLIEKGRETLVGAVYEDYVKIAGEALGQANATVTSALPLTVEEATNVKAQFEQMIGKKVRIENIVDPSLLGGLQVRIGDRLYDGSLSGKLARLEKSLKQAQAL